MTVEAWWAVSIIVASVLLLTINRYPAYVVLLGGVALLLTTGVLTPRQALAGFVNEGMATVGVLYVVVAGLQETGAVGWITDTILGVPRSIRHAQWRMSLPIVATSPFINNTPVVAMFTPAVDTWTKRYQLPISQLMIPLAFVTTAAGLCTLVGSSTNLIVHTLLRDKAGLPGFSLWELGWIGVPVTATVFLYVIGFGKQLLPHRASSHFTDPQARLAADHPTSPRRAALALVILLVFVVLATLSHFSTLTAALLSAGLMVMTGCVSGYQAWRTIEWPILLVIAASFAFGTALESSGAAQYFASTLIAWAKKDVLGSLTMIYVVTALLTQIVTNNATAALMFPIALATARDL
ncbi:MAG: hypothetical protein HQL60_03450, partial [Magnetococcales bacterium]|nr:hypothetical protein [Magnetococcales bacterium]